MTRRGRGLAGLSVLLVLGACSTKYIKFPAEEFLIRHWKERLYIQDQTHPARERCKVIRAVLIAPGTSVPVVTPPPAKLEEKRVKCDELDNRMRDYEAWDLVVIRASLKGDTIDKESVDNLRNVIGPILGLAADIVK